MLRVADFLGPSVLPPPPLGKKLARTNVKKLAVKRQKHQPSIENAFVFEPRIKRVKKTDATHKTTSDLQFIYRKLNEDDEEESFVACNATHAMKLTEPFDFEDYARDTNTHPFPPQFQELVQRAIDYYNHPPSVPEYTLAHFSGTLRPKQVEALEFVLARHKRILALPTGLGKTAISYAAIATQWEWIMSTEQRVLVVCPASLRRNWSDEGTKLFLTSHAANIAIVKHSSDATKVLQDVKNKVIIVSYTMLASIHELLWSQKWHMLICDEAHYLQSSKSHCSQSVAKLREKMEFIILCSATPCDNTIVYWNLLRVLEPAIFEHFFHYKPPHINWPLSTTIFYYAERYVFPEKVYTATGRLQWVFKQCMRRNELHALCRQFVLQQRKEDALQDVLPLKHEVVVVGRATQDEHTTFQAAMERIVEVEKQKGNTYAQSLFMEQVRATAKQKIPFVLSYVRELVTSDPTLKFILFAYHKDVLNDLSHELEQLEIKHVLVHGDIPEKERPALFNQLKEDPETRIGVFSLACCSLGLNFTYLQLLIYAELIFNAKIMTQAAGRCERIGQKAQSIARYLIYENSTDQLVWAALQRKRDNESVILRNEHKKLSFTRLLALQTPSALHPKYEMDDDTQQSILISSDSDSTDSECKEVED